MKKCPICGKDTTSTKHPNKVYCSVACVSKARKNAVKIVIKDCANCSSPFQVTYDKKTYCSKRCSDGSRKQTLPKKCSACGETKPLSAFPKGTKCKICFVRNDEYRARARSWGIEARRRIRLEVIAGYGGKCVCCGESEWRFLCVDHKFNDGNAERKAKLTGYTFFCYLKKSGFPRDRYQLLCFNCNMGKQLYGVCPHKEKTDL